MKRIVLTLLAALALSACQNNSKQETTAPADSALVNPVITEDLPKIEVENSTYNFGKIIDGEKVKYEFKFKNVGKTPLIITDASATCGCTVPEYPKAPVKPGESGIIKVEFNSAGKVGIQDKVVTINSNANPAFEQLHLVGEVLAKK